LFWFLGATGTLGKPVSYALKNAEFKVRIITRDFQKASKIFDNSFEIVAGDPVDPNCLEKALEGCYGVHISLPNEIELQAAQTVVKVASRESLKRISYISGATVAEEHRWYSMINRKFQTEMVIKGSEIPYTIFCPTWVMDGLPMFVNQGRAFVFGKQPCPYHWVAADDIARMVSTAYGLEEAANKRFIIYGPEAIHLREALTSYCRVFHPSLKEVSSMPFWLVKTLGTITRNSELKEAGEMMSYFEKVGETTSAPKIDGILSAPTITLDQWLKKRKVTQS
jgi:uncharacterized protein YbjT (DUF2867 family)